MNVVRALTVGAVAVVMCYISASILWVFGGTTVTDGPVFASATSLLVLILGFILMMRINHATQDSATARWLGLAIESTLLVIAAITWRALDLYYVGWLATFGAIVLAVASLWQLLSDLLAFGPSRGDSRADVLSRQRAVKLGTVAATGAAVGIVVLIFLEPIHLWRLEIVSPVLVIVSTALFIALLVLRLLGPAQKTSRHVFSGHGESTEASGTGDELRATRADSVSPAS